MCPEDIKAGEWVVTKNSDDRIGEVVAVFPESLNIYYRGFPRGETKTVPRENVLGRLINSNLGMPDPNTVSRALFVDDHGNIRKGEVVELDPIARKVVVAIWGPGAKMGNGAMRSWERYPEEVQVLDPALSETEVDVLLRNASIAMK